MKKAELILHPVRMHIILKLHQRALTARQLAEELPDIATTTLYHHLGLLTKAGLLRVVEERQVRGTLNEKTYTLVQGSTTLGEEEMRQASSEELMQYFQVFVSGLLGEFAHYLEHRDASTPTDAGCQTIPLELTDEEFAQFAEAFKAFLRPWSQKQPAPERRRRHLSLVMISQMSKASEKTAETVDPPSSLT
ncbi:ArsR family transcriptional regulator [Ktedonosporobacter rubrisoli]|uniref:ArsR family transcriptional regulator n=1 Tax=Ktedonosporobacter rubrisoli TaxID=2509675 RepID=A0A4P6JL20_KTERU|nr:helix-turn-helix domain-containing protein [Ktedonosporobacter rubrisoli]QBD75682.1 ArsR family transcriptional regulator [Ktedonosporobacter rubrisoli]